MSASEANNHSAGNKPAALFDIDGTLLIWQESPEPPEGYAMYPKRHKLPVSLEAYHLEVPVWMQKLTEKHVDVYYITDWLQDSHDHFGKLINLPRFPYIPYINYGPPENPMSRAKAISALFRNRPVVWFDDAIDEKVLAWADHRDQTHAPTKAVQVDKNRGIEPTHIEEADRWLGNLSLNNA